MHRRQPGNPYDPSRPQPGPYPGGPPRWARKRILLPAAFVTLMVGVALGGTSAAEGGGTGNRAAPHPTVTTTVTATATPGAAPAPTVTATETVRVEATVRTTVTATAPAPVVDREAGTGGGSGEDHDGGSVPFFYENCDAARAAGDTPVLRGEPGYGPHLDRDADGVGCDG
ncbi:excalibur calcium-binding domain-containing protein [Streptomyces sp. JJ36]|uniref:excalibur calcium-binding domain-containing protein n=1 Tax=Streptomyces sp. JJ36 TaxID=2736645 RepID=UPI001F222E17|nr:excalibur calcium-binding domain-containing protein [Streptomyces sp. JJ36]MCF6521510.1 excalibur calcium-binding domain-containing protein [Streptomyces sp. JJ36]